MSKLNISRPVLNDVVDIYLHPKPFDLGHIFRNKLLYVPTYRMVDFIEQFNQLPKFDLQILFDDELTSCIGFTC